MDARVRVARELWLYRGLSLYSSIADVSRNCIGSSYLVVVLDAKRAGDKVKFELLKRGGAQD
jgi:hypothetical protein